MNCAVKCCRNNRRNCDGKSFFKFPKNKEDCDEWLQSIGRMKYIPTIGSNVCEDHFNQSFVFNRGSRKRLTHLAIPVHDIFKCKKCNKNVVYAEKRKNPDYRDEEINNLNESVKSPEYSNQVLKQKAYQKLVDLIRPMFPHANKDFVTRKINAIRGYFRRELKKVLASTKSAEAEGGNGKIYEPSLWYFDLLLFTKDQEIAPVKSHDNDSIHSSSIKIQSNKTTRNIIYENVPVTRRKRKRSFNTYMQKFTEICENALQTRSELSEYDAIGVNVAKKLEKMDPLQAMYAESLINKILKKGLSKKLSAETIVREKITIF